MRKRTLYALLTLPLLLASCGETSDAVGSWVADVDATMDQMIQAQLASLPPEARAAAQEQIQRIKDNVPASMRAGVEATQFELKADGSWTGRSPGGDVAGTWKQEGDDYLLTADGGESMTATLSGGMLMVSGPGMPFTLVLRPE